MSQDPPSLHYKDQVASVQAERRRPHPQRDPDGALMAAKDGTLLLVAKSDEVSPTHQAKTGVSSGRTSKRQSSVAAVTETVVPIAFPVVDDGNNPAAPPQSKNDHHRKSFPWRVVILSVMVAVVAIAGVVVGVVCGSGHCGGTSAEPSPTIAPTEDPEPTIPPWDRAQNITDLINSKTYMGFNLSPTGTSPEEQALQWLINDDPLQLNTGDEVDEFRLLQRYSLLTLWFQASTGTAWIDSTNWLNANECSWFGISCQSSVVTVVNFYTDELEVGKRLQGSLSPDLGLLTDLEQFDVGNNTLTGSLPSEIGLWKNLDGFAVASNFLTGSLHSEIGLWTNLRQFLVYDNRLTGSMPSEIGLWTNLEIFTVSENSLKGSLPSEIGSWTNLEWFGVSENRLTGSLPSEIGLWTNLEWFVAWTNLLSGSLPSKIGLWTNLEVINVASNELIGSLPTEIGSWTNLREFYVYTNAFTGFIPETIVNWTLIERAKFYENTFSGSMPVGICEFISGNDVLEADCDLTVNCTCCTKCW